MTIGTLVVKTRPERDVFVFVMLLLVFGIIIGLLFACIVFIVALWQKPIIDRQLKKTQSKLKQKGAILEPDNEELENWIKTL